MNAPTKVGISAGLSYFGILVLLLIREMYAVGTEVRGDTLTEVIEWLSLKVPWFGAIVMGFLTWLWIHFAQRILPVLKGVFRR